MPELCPPALLASGGVCVGGLGLGSLVGAGGDWVLRGVGFHPLAFGVRSRGRGGNALLGDKSRSLGIGSLPPLQGETASALAFNFQQALIEPVIAQNHLGLNNGNIFILLLFNFFPPFKSGC